VWQMNAEVGKKRINGTWYTDTFKRKM